MGSQEERDVYFTVWKGVPERFGGVELTLLVLFLVMLYIFYF